MMVAPAPKPVVLVLLAHYLPGYKAGGPIRSIANMVEALSDDLDFRIVTSDRDIGERRPFGAVERCRWVEVGKARVLYLPNTLRAFLMLVRTLWETPADVLYLNSFFARRFSMAVLFLRGLHIFRPHSVLLAPRGEFSPGALHIKSWRKRLYIGLAKLAGLYNNVLWHASSQFEERDIHHAFCGDESIAVAGPIAADNTTRMRIMTALDMPGMPTPRSEEQKRAKAAGSIRLVFVSRICKKKNLDGALSLVSGLGGDVQFDIYGPVEDRGYWKHCQALIARLPENVTAHYRGEVPHDRIAAVLAAYDALLFPTLGENYGHVIREALAAGCPVFVSDQTPWRGLEDAGVGWDLPLDDEARFRAAVQSAIGMHPEIFAAWSARAREYALRMAKDPEIIRQNRQLFARALGVE